MRLGLGRSNAPPSADTCRRHIRGECGPWLLLCEPAVCSDGPLTGRVCQLRSVRSNASGCALQWTRTPAEARRGEAQRPRQPPAARYGGEFGAGCAWRPAVGARHKCGHTGTESELMVGAQHVQIGLMLSDDVTVASMLPGAPTYMVGESHRATVSESTFTF